MEHPKAIGDRTTLAVMLALHEAGYRLLVPFGENTRYDVVIDDGGGFARVQCKTGRLRSGAVRFKTCSSYAHHPNPKLLRRDYTGEVDFFGVYCPENGRVYSIPLAAVPLRTMAALRVDPARNSQMRGIRFAADYEIARLRSDG
ncbi:MAG TPA: group I intron-associated PD-(D/E)XK endonuclease [Vicinamibacterales bacterium]|nr:group I intron-associated PD-(D/E)XK endonuclease [Vicinamibacterales bacterium]